MCKEGLSSKKNFIYFLNKSIVVKFSINLGKIEDAWKYLACHIISARLCNRT